MASSRSQLRMNDGLHNGLLGVTWSIKSLEFRAGLEILQSWDRFVNDRTLCCNGMDQWPVLS